MRIAIVTASFLPRIGGAEFVVHHLAQQWCKQKHEVRVFNYVTDRPSHPDALYSVSKYRVLKGSSRFGEHRFPFSWHASRRIGQLLRRFDPEFISAHFCYPVGIWLSRLRPSPQYMITCHGPLDWHPPIGDREWESLKPDLVDAVNHAVAVVAISPTSRETMVESGVDEEKIVDIRNGVDLDEFKARVDGFDLRASFGIPATGRIVLSVGRESWEKAYDTGISAFARVASEIPDVYYVIVGRGSEKWRSLATETGLDGRVLFCEGLYGEQLIGAYQQADVFFLPSKSEFCPLVVPEAMAAGLPEVVTNVGANAEMVEDGKNGFVVKSGDVAQMAEALSTLILDASLRQRMGGVGRAKSESHGWSHISRQYLKYGRSPVAG